MEQLIVFESRLAVVNSKFEYTKAVTGSDKVTTNIDIAKNNIL